MRGTMPRRRSLIPCWSACVALGVVVGAQVGAHLSIAVVGYQPGAVNTRAWLADLVAATLSDFALDGVGI